MKALRRWVAARIDEARSIFPNNDERLVLLGIDLEDNQDLLDAGSTRASRVDVGVSHLLETMQVNDVKATFFTVGDCARAHPELLKDLHQAGHEIACHSDTHIPLEKHTQESFRESLQRNIDAIESVTGERPLGFRAPQLSLTQESAWVWGALSDLGFRYSSSVLPARNPLYGWEEFGKESRKIDGIWEIPVSVGGIGNYKVPFASGLYLRLLPEGIFSLLCHYTQSPLVMYVHPYDADPEQPYFPMTEHWTWSRLLFVRRERTTARLHRILRKRRSRRYGEFVNSLEQASRTKDAQKP